jgi:hypothetical protein
MRTAVREILQARLSELDRQNGGPLNDGQAIELVQRALQDLSPESDGKRELRATALQLSGQISELGWLRPETEAGGFQRPSLSFWSSGSPSSSPPSGCWPQAMSRWWEHFLSQPYLLRQHLILSLIWTTRIWVSYAFPTCRSDWRWNASGGRRSSDRGHQTIAASSMRSKSPPQIN